MRSCERFWTISSATHGLAAGEHGGGTKLVWELR